jgi:hypothetical protein
MKGSERALKRPSLFWRKLSLAVCVAGLVACGERSPTAVDDTQIPGEPITLEISLPWSSFGSNLRVYGGFGSPGGLKEGIIANNYADTLNARTLIRFGAYPQSAQVRDTNNVVRTDTNLTLRDGYVVAVFDTIASTNTGPVTLALGALQDEWDAISASWTAAVDSVGDHRDWAEAGAGPVANVVMADWDPSAGDSVFFPVDSALIAAWSDQADLTRGARIEVLTDGVRLHMNGGALLLNATSTLNPDTLIVLTSNVLEVTFVYDPQATPPADGLRVGGAPAWRSVFDIALPTEINGPPELCAEVGCPFALEPKHVSYASIGLTSRQTEGAFQPTDTIGLDARAVLSPGALPKSPLSSSFLADPRGVLVGPDAFGPSGSRRIAIPITSFVQGFLAGPDPAGRPPPSTLALLAASEPETFWYASFFGPGGPTEPTLTLIVTVSRPMEIQ